MHEQHGAVDEVALEDLYLYIRNTSQLYPQRQAAQQNIERRLDMQTYDPAAAWKILMPLVDNGAKMYAREFREHGNVFSRATREALAQRMAHDEYTEIVLQRQVGHAERRREEENRYGANESPRGERIHVVQGMYNGRWEDVTAETTRKEGLERLREYRENEPGTAFRIISMREPASEADEGPRPWPRRSAREDGPGGSLRWIQTGDVYEAKAPLGGGKYVINVDPNGGDGFQTWYLPVSKDEEAPMLGTSTTLGGAMQRAKEHANQVAGVRRAAEGAGERVPVIHEDPEVVAASVTTTETATVVAAKEDFKTAAMAEQHAYTEGFRYIAERGRKYDIYKRRKVGKKGYEKREMYFRRGKWHISGDKSIVSRLGRGAYTIKVDQQAKTIPLAPAAEENAKFERCVKSVKKRGDDVNPYAVCHASVGEEGVPRRRYKKPNDRGEWNMLVRTDRPITQIDRVVGRKHSRVERLDPKETRAKYDIYYENMRGSFDRMRRRLERKFGENVGVSFVGKEASEKPAEAPAAEECAPCAAHEACEKHPKKRKDTGETVEIEQPIVCNDGSCVPWLKIERDTDEYRARMEKAKALGPISTPKKVFELMSGALGKEDQEVFVVICVDLHGHLRGVFEVARGQRSKVSVGIQDVMRAAILSGCAGAIVCHCHPSDNSVTPSDADKQLTKDIEDAMAPYAGECVLLDHCVLTTDACYSIMHDGKQKVA